MRLSCCLYPLPQADDDDSDDDEEDLSYNDVATSVVIDAPKINPNAIQIECLAAPDL